MARIGEERRLATLLVFVRALEHTAPADILDPFDGLLTALTLRGETKRRRERLRSLKDLNHAALVLQRAVRILLDETVPAGSIRQRVLGRIGEVPLRAAADAVQALASSDDDPQLQALSGSYATVRRFLPALLNGIIFKGSPLGQTPAGCLALFTGPANQRAWSAEVGSSSPYPRVQELDAAGVS